MEEHYITKKEIEELTFNDLENYYLNLDNSEDKILSLLQICKIFENLLKQMQVKILTSQRKNFYILNTEGLIEENNIEFQNLMVFGAQLIFSIRSLILDETIDFLLGGQSEDGTILYEKKVSQSEILQNLNASLSAHAVLLNSEMEKFNDKDKALDILNKLWEQINVLTDYEDITSKNNGGSEFGIKPYTYIDKKGEKHISYRKYYRKKSRDYNVYIGYRGRKKNKYGYYKLDDGDFTFFNRGWLYEWFKAYTLDNTSHVNNLINSISDNSNQTPLKSFISKVDTLPGYKGGDIQVGKRQYQVKFTNLRIISFTSIITVIKSLQIILGEYQKATNIESKKKQIIKLLQLFIDENNLKLINQGYDDRIEELLKIFETKKS